MYVWKNSTAIWSINSTGWMAQEHPSFLPSYKKFASYGNIPYKFQDGSRPKNVMFSDGTFIWRGFNFEYYAFPGFNYRSPSGTYTSPYSMVVTPEAYSTTISNRNSVLENYKLQVKFNKRESDRDWYTELHSYTIKENGKTVTNYDTSVNYTSLSEPGVCVLY